MKSRGRGQQGGWSDLKCWSVISDLSHSLCFSKTWTYSLWCHLQVSEDQCFNLRGAVNIYSFLEAALSGHGILGCCLFLKPTTHQEYCVDFLRLGLLFPSLYPLTISETTAMSCKWITKHKCHIQPFLYCFQPLDDIFIKILSLFL